MLGPASERRTAVRPPRRRRGLMIRLTERFAALILAAITLVCWQIAVPVLGLSAFVLPTPYAIAMELRRHDRLMLDEAYYT